MGIFSRIFRSRTRGKQGYTTKDGTHGIWIYLQCDKCSEKIAVRLRTTSELQRREGSEAEQGPGEYFIQKTVVGSNCYQRIEATVDFDSRYNVVGSQVKNGRLLTVAEYEAKNDEQN